MKAFLKSIAAAVILTACQPIQAQTELDRDRMNRDLEIMEGVLSRMIASDVMGSQSVRGVYFEDYGVIFWVGSLNTMPFIGNFNFKIKAPVLGVDSDEQHAVVIPEPGKGKMPAIYGRRFPHSLTRTELESRILEFLGTYADAIGQLNPGHRISVLVERTRGLVFHFSDEEEEAESPRLLASVLSSDVADFRRGEFDENEFRRRIKFDDTDSDATMRRNMDIMSSIFDTALSRKYHQGFGASGDGSGTYVPGLGAIFFLSGDLGGHSFKGMFDDYVHQEVEDVIKEAEGASQAVLDTYKSVLMDIMTDYGHTIRNLPADENLIVVAGFDQGFMPDRRRASQLVIKVKKQFVDDFNDGKLNRADLRGRMLTEEF